MRQPAFLPPQKTKPLRFSLKTLFILITCAGPLVLVAGTLPREFYHFQGRFTLEVLCIAGLAWFASYVRPGPLAAFFFLLTVVLAVLGMLLLVGRRTDYEMLLQAIGISLRATLTTGLAVGLSWSRHAR